MSTGDLTAAAPFERVRAQAPDAAATRAKRPPVLVWAGVGAVLIAFIAYLMLAWVFSDDFRPTEAGPTPVPDVMKVVIPIVIAANLAITVAIIWFFLVKPWRREGHLTTDGAFALSFLLIWWQDPLQNIIAPYFTYNAWLANMGSWAGHIPGWPMPNADRLAHPLIFSIPGFFLFFPCVLLTNAFMRRLQARKPGISTVQLVGAAFVVISLSFFAIELVWMRVGLYTYPFTVEELTLFAGHYYQIPIYEPLILGACLTGFACLRYFKNDRGETMADRGIEALKVSPAKKGLLRFLAIFGAINVMFFGYNLALQPFILNADGIPRDIQERSYFLDEFCGPGTDLACWNRALPFPTPGSGHVDPDGRFVPGDEPVPEPIPFKTD